LRAVILDVDGTLAETERDGHRVAYNRAFASLGIDVHWSVEEYGRWLSIAGGKERLEAYFRAHPEHAPSSFDFDEIHRAKNRFYAEIVAAGAVQLRPGVRRLLDELHAAKVAVAVASTTTFESLEALLRVALGDGWEDRFSAFALGDVVVHKKPDPGIYNWALGALGVSYDTAVAIEDNRNGLLAAKGAGLRVVVTPSAYFEHEHFDEADVVASSLGEHEAPATITRAGERRSGVVDLELLAGLVAP
jgi:HAD superfamily hydrolase (TIGR01509 family)